MKAKYQLISLDLITDPANPLRGEITPESVIDLVSSIKQVGIIEPLIVAKKAKLYEVIAGHRRLVAAKIADLTEVPCLVTKTKGMEAETLKLHENLARVDISPIEWSKHLHHLKTKSKLDNKQLAKKMGRSESWVSQHLTISTYPPSLIAALEDGTMSFTAARELAMIKDTNTREMYIKFAVKGGISPTLAVQWRQKANRELDRATDQQAPADGEPEAPPQEPLCQEEVKPHEHVTLVVHDRCQPKD